MKEPNHWRKVSNISAYTCGTIVIIHTFFGKYLLDYITVVIVIEAATIALFIVSEAMKLTMRKQYKARYVMWKRLRIYEALIAVFFLINIILSLFDIKKYLGKEIPGEIFNYAFWLSLGFYLGFEICKYEIRRSTRTSLKSTTSTSQYSRYEQEKH